MVSPVTYNQKGSIAVISINRPAQRNAINQHTGRALRKAFERLDEDGDVDVGVVTGAGGTFSAGADLAEFVSGSTLENKEYGFMGFSHIRTEKPLIAAIEGYAVGGGLELALFCDLRVAAESAIFGCFERQAGAPLLDGGTQRLPRIIGLGRALDMIFTGRDVGADEAQRWGLVNRVVDDGEALSCAVSLGREISSFPSKAILTDRQAVYDGLGVSLERGLAIESWWGMHAMTAARESARQMIETEGEG